jgi:ribonuclease BN (tRNA processing enzyme)
MAVLADDADAPTLVLDAGTGLRGLSRLLHSAPFHGDIVLTHLHWDHLQGLPFCTSVDDPQAATTLHVPARRDDDPLHLLSRTLSPPFFPIAPDGLLGEWHYQPLQSGTFTTRDGARVTAAPVAHKGGLTLGLRVELRGATLAYVPDHAWNADTPHASRQSALELAAGADLLLHDGQFLASEGERSRSYGHSTIEGAAGFADACEVGMLALTHHAPYRTDADLDQLAARWKCTPQGRPIVFARQDESILVVERVSP